MTQIVIDDVLRNNLVGLTGPVLLHDTSGRVIAEARPVADAEVEPRTGRQEGTTRIVIVDTLRDRLNDLKEPAELCDSWGLVVATVAPVDHEPPISEEELAERRKNTAPGYTTAEVLKYLESL
jgi:hypothetical protein